MSKFDKLLGLGVLAFVLLVVSNGIPTYSGEYLEERYINYDQPIYYDQTPGNEEKVLAMTSEQVAAMWQLEVVLLTPEEVAAEKAAAAKKVADQWQLIVTH